MPATLSQLDTLSTFSPPGPIVLSGPELRDDLSVLRLTMSGPLDTRAAELSLRRGRAGYDTHETARAAALIGRELTILQPVALSGGQQRLIPLLQGRVAGSRQKLDGRRDSLVLTATCDWSRRLTEVSPLHESLPMSLGELLRRLVPEVSTQLLPAALRSRAVPAGLFAGRTVGAVLEAVCDLMGLVVRRQVHGSSHRWIERRDWLSAVHGRPVRLGLTQTANPASAIASFQAVAAHRLPVKLVGRGSGQVVESTFELRPAWATAEALGPEDRYRRSNPYGFDAVAHVLRLWVLNEDGAFAGLPRFDLTTLFDQGRAIRPQPLRLGPCLTLDPAGRSLGLVVELSLDDGASWQRYGGLVRNLQDRAGVYLDDDSLVPQYLWAARTGRARLRVTSTLSSPLPLETVLWRGNPFVGEFRQQSVELGQTFRYRRVAASSKYHGSGLAADTADDRPAMRAWLAELPLPDAETGRVEIQTVGVMPTLRIGDRLDRLAGRRIAPDGSDAATPHETAVIRHITHDYTSMRSKLICQM